MIFATYETGLSHLNINLLISIISSYKDCESCVKDTKCLWCEEQNKCITMVSLPMAFMHGQCSYWSNMYVLHRSLEGLHGCTTYILACQVSFYNLNVLIIICSGSSDSGSKAHGVL